ncbi:MAG TPA: type I-C CRISPR-associated endonuclease Cas1c [Rectinema sp.]|nr:type I-C CRISPR-associated endonuclease Cas1 [Treponema sp.]HOO02372.1 type I-C CRISPR-associated endonuclease Cas1c [Rectinema sp.]HOR91965.1 type I-C CRISPR-associated endonuclease Cas1c [Rectinema sp.]HOU61309.1 type I-C CRISPR-associated endonuclease Cas1c [Rectinema sp.]HPL72189.1 type I-C CRISPR-associated endonuclease Cas1c [Rectinema sp.]
MRKLLNTLYVTSQGSYIHKEGETIIVEREQQKVLQLPVHTLGGIVCFGNVLCSPFLLGFCAEHDISISFLTEYGSFLASVRGPVSGNVLLRREQYRIADNSEKSAKIAANIVTGKLMNSRLVMNRAIRDHGDKIDIATIRRASSSIYRLIEELALAVDLDEIRGIEGMAASEYFAVFNQLIVDQKEDFVFNERNRRPPLDPVNALLSFIYTLLVHDVRSALETVGLDPTVGFLHRDRPGRPGLALDLMEEFRPVIADRLVLSLINRRQVAPNGFKKAESGAVVMDDSTRKTVLVEYQNRKQDEIFHPYIEEKIPLGLLFFVQANLMARFIRGDIDGYPPFFWR